MKCWTWYALPWVMAFCLFLGSAFFSLEADAAQEDAGSQYAVDKIMASVDGDLYTYNVVVSLSIPGYSDYIYLYSTTAPLMYFLDNGYGVLGFSDSPGDFIVYKYNESAGHCSFESQGSRKPLPDNFLMRGLGKCYSSSYDIYRCKADGEPTGELFFQGPSPFQQAVRGQDWTAVMMEILIILPLSIVSLTFLIGLRKGLRHILTFLHRA